MGRPARNSQGGYVYHVVQRGCKVKPIFRSTEDYQDLERILGQMHERFEPRILAYCLLPKHWHLVVVPRKDGDLSKLVAWMSITHSARWHTRPRRTGTGSIYVRRFRSFPVQDNERLLDILRFVESHPVRAGLVDQAEQWTWSSLPSRLSLTAEPKPWIANPPVALPDSWREQMDVPIEPALNTAILRSMEKGSPYGDPDWIARTSIKLGLESTLRSRGRPKKQT